MRTAWGVLLVLSLTACQTTAELNCSREGYEEGTPEFRECVRTQRIEGSVRMKQEAGQGM